MPTVIKFPGKTDANALDRFTVHFTGGLLAKLRVEPCMCGLRGVWEAQWPYTEDGSHGIARQTIAEWHWDKARKWYHRLLGIPPEIVLKAWVKRSHANLIRYKDSASRVDYIKGML